MAKKGTLGWHTMYLRTYTRCVNSRGVPPTCDASPNGKLCGAKIEVGDEYLSAQRMGKMKLVCRSCGEKLYYIPRDKP